MADVFEIRCGICGKAFKNELALKGHTRMVHPGQIDQPVEQHPEDQPETPEQDTAPPGYMQRTAPKKARLKDIPGWSAGVRENASIRMVKMVQPICPFSQKTYDTTPEGRVVERRDEGAQPNCQRAGGQWWIDCEARGHNPYMRKRIWYSKQDIYDTEASTGEQVKTGERTVRHEDDMPNIAQVAAHIRVNSGRGPEFKHTNHGFRYLAEMGFAEVCEMRNCQKPITVDSVFGKYCSMNHAALCGADGIGTKVTQIPGTFDQGNEIEVRLKRQGQLRQAADAMRAQKISK